MSYLRATDPYPLQSAEHNRLHEFYAHLAEGRLTTTRCLGCGRTAWPPRGFCAECCSDRYEWADLEATGAVRAFTIQEAGVPPGFPRPLVFAIVEVQGLRIFAPILDAEPARLRLGAPVRFTPMRVADGPDGSPRYLAAFLPA